MREIERTRLIRAKLSWTRRRFVRRVALSFCFLSSVISLGFLGKPDPGVDAARLKVPQAPHREFAKSARAADGLWRSSANRNKLSLNEKAQRELLNHAPMENTKAARQTQVVMGLPMPDGTFSRFTIEESPVMAPELAARFPHIKTYRGRGLDDPTATTRFDVTPEGFHAIVLTSAGATIVEPAPHGSEREYVSYDQRDAPKEAGAFSCTLLGAEQASFQSKKLSRKGNANVAPLATFALPLRESCLL